LPRPLPGIIIKRTSLDAVYAISPQNLLVCLIGIDLTSRRMHKSLTHQQPHRSNGQFNAAGDLNSLTSPRFHTDTTPTANCNQNLPANCNPYPDHYTNTHPNTHGAHPGEPGDCPAAGW